MFYSQEQNKDKSTRFLMQKWSEQQLALKLRRPQEEAYDDVYISGLYPNYQSSNYEQTYMPKDQRYNKNYDEIGFGIKKVKLNEDSRARSELELDKKLPHQRDILSGSIDYSKGTSICPLRNFQNNDNLNAVLQVLFATYPLTHYILNDYYKDDLNDAESRFKGQIIISYSKALVMNKNTKQLIAPFDMLQTIYRFAPQFEYGDLYSRPREDVGIPMSDPLEILRFLLEGLHDDLNRVKYKPPSQEVEIPPYFEEDEQYISQEYQKYFSSRENSVITDCFSGQMYTRSICNTCKHRKVTFYNFNDLTFDLPNEAFSMRADLIDLIAQNAKVFKRQQACSNSKCSYAQYPGDHQIYECIWRFPVILFIHLKRFKYNRPKSNVFINFPYDSLDMTSTHSQSDHESKDFAHNYKLYAILHHQGDNTSGHYFAEVLNLHDQKWYTCDDALVQVREGQVSNKSNTAYILMYYRKK